MKKYGFLMASLLAVSLGAAELDRGGVTFDFKKISDTRFAAAQAGQEANLISNGDFLQENDPKDPYCWRDSYCFIHHADKAKVDPWRSQVRSMVKWEIKDGVASIEKTPALEELCGPIAANVSGGWGKYVRMPNLEGGTYKLSFYYQARHASAGNNYVLVSFKGEHQQVFRGKDVVPLQVKPFPDSAGEWTLFTQEIVVPPETCNLGLVFRIDGVGSLKLKDVRLQAVKTEEPLTVALSPHGFLDRTFALSQNQPAVMTFTWKRNVPAARLQLRNPEMVLTLPTPVEFKESSTDFPVTGKCEVSIDGKSYREHRISLRSIASRPAKIDGFDFYLVLPALVTTAEKPGAQPGEGFCRIEDDGKTVSNSEKFSFLVIPEIKTTEKNQLYRQGSYIGGRYYYFSDAGNELVARFFGDNGLRWLVSTPTGNQLAMWRKYGVDTVTPELYYVANGYRVGEPAKRPVEDRYVYLGESSDPNLKMAACPASIYEKRPYYAGPVTEYMRKNLTGTDGLWGNWEPYMFTGKGCFCERCCDHFAEFVGVSPEEMKKHWPQDLARGKQYYEQGVRFRSLEHAKLVKTINESVIELTGKDKSLGFIPGVAWIEMASCRRSHGQEQQAIDYAEALRWIDPWGPYPCWRSQTPYVYRKEGTLNTFVAARDVRQQIDRDYPAGKRPRLQALPHGIQIDAWVTQPEALEMDFNSFFFNGFEAAVAYIFPRGYDNRYWAACARAAEQSARFEQMVFNGKRIDQQVTVAPYSPFALNSGKVNDYLSEAKDVPLLQAVAYELNGKIIVPVFNFWQNGEAFFNLKLSGLNSQERYQVKAGNRFFVPDGRSFYTGQELANGIKLHAGAMRCVVYEITPGSASTNGEFWTLKQLDSLLAERRADLEQAAIADRKYEELYGVRESTLVNLKSGTMTCTADQAKGLLRLSDGANTLELNCRNMSVSDWQVNGVPVVSVNGNYGWGTTAFWEPSVMFKAPYRVVKQESVDGGIRIIGELPVNNQVCVELDGLLIRQTVEVTDNCRKTTLKTELVNRSTDEAPRPFTMGLRYHGMPMAPAVENGKILLYNGAQTVEHHRNFGRTMYSTGDATFEEKVTKTFGIAGQPVRITSAKAELVWPKLTGTLFVTPADRLAGFALWDGPSQLTTTFEPCFQLVELKKSGDQAEYQMTVELR